MTYWTKEEGIFGAVYNGLMDGNEGTLRGPREFKMENNLVVVEVLWRQK